MKPHKPKHVEKRWGSETWFANNEEHNYCGKILHITKGKNTSMHFHINKHEVFQVLEGVLQVDWIDTKVGFVNKCFVDAGECMEMQQGVPHRLIANKEDVKIIEASTFHRDSDSYRVYL